MSDRTNARKFHDGSKKKSRANEMSACLTRLYTDTISDALAGRSAKQIARDTGVSDRVADNWRSGTNGPSGAHLVRLMREYDEVFERVMDLTGRMSGASLSPAQREAARRALAILAGD